MAEVEKIMFEIYRVEGDALQYNVIYYTELDEQTRDAQIAKAMSGQHLYDGFITDESAATAKQIIEQIITRLNLGESLTEQQVDEMLIGYVVA